MSNTFHINQRLIIHAAPHPYKHTQLATMVIPTADYYYWVLCLNTNKINDIKTLIKRMNQYL